MSFCLGSRDRDREAVDCLVNRGKQSQLMPISAELMKTNNPKQTYRVYRVMIH